MCETAYAFKTFLTHGVGLIRNTGSSNCFSRNPNCPWLSLIEAVQKIWPSQTLFLRRAMGLHLSSLTRYVYLWTTYWYSLGIWNANSRQNESAHSCTFAVSRFYHILCRTVAFNLPGLRVSAQTSCSMLQTPCDVMHDSTIVWQPLRFCSSICEIKKNCFRFYVYTIQLYFFKHKNRKC